MMDRFDFLAATAASVAVAGSGSLSRDLPSSIAGVDIPDSRLARSAMVLVRNAEPLEIFFHSLRTFVFAALLGRHQREKYDAEMLFVASILHDSGLAPTFISKTERFEVDGANLSRKLLKEHGIAGTRADVVWDAICLHDQSMIARWKPLEVRLVCEGVNADFGAFQDVLTDSEIRAVLTAAPRTNFIPVFLDAVAEVVKRKPFATGHSFATDVGYKMVPGFHLDNVVDAFQADPFARYGF